jgi:glycosyl transferase family 25
LSHVLCWQTFVNSAAQHALVLEDDVLLHADAAALLADVSWIPAHVQLLKIESYGPASQRILVGKPTRVASGTSIAPLHSKHTGSGGYIITRALAFWLLNEVRVWPMSIDQMLFNPHISPITDIIRPFQLIPALAKQVDLKESSDIEEWRAPFRRPGWATIKRSIRRSYNDLSIVPRQVLDVFIGRSRLIRI